MPDPSPHKMPDTVRDHLANERTFLAWIRTAVSLLGFGVLVARLNVAAGVAAPTSATGTTFGLRHSVLLGLLFMTSGLATLFLAVWDYFRTRRMIEAGDYTPLGWTLAAFAFLIALLGCAGVVYLLLLNPP